LLLVCFAPPLVDLGCFSSSWFFFLTFSATPGLGWLSWFLVFF
jgi:hypothetical protein